MIIKSYSIFTILLSALISASFAYTEISPQPIKTNIFSPESEHTTSVEKMFFPSTLANRSSGSGLSSRKILTIPTWVTIWNPVIQLSEIPAAAYIKLNSPHQSNIPNGYLTGIPPDTTRKRFSPNSAITYAGALSPWLLPEGNDHGDDHGGDHGDDDDCDDWEIISPGLIKTVSQDTASTGMEVIYAITISNPLEDDSENDHDDDHGDDDNCVYADTILVQINDILPTSFTYVAGTSNGLTTSDPDIQANVLTWNGPWIVPVGQSLTLNFHVNVGLNRGHFDNDVIALFNSGNTISTGPTAPVQVIGPQLVLTKSVDKYNASPGDTLTYTVFYLNSGDDNATYVFILEHVPDNTTYVTGSAQGADMTILFSQDGGVTYGTNQNNPTDISFQRTINLTPGETGQITFRVVVQ